MGAGGTWDVQSGSSTLKDLWHWNGDLRKPVWTRVVETTGVLWPPHWQAPQGWTSDAAEAGELWLAEGSGSVKYSILQTENHVADVSVR